MSMKRKFAVSSMWTVIAAGFNNVSTMIVFIVLARLLTPVEFGTVAFATVFIDLSRALVLAGIPDALIQRRDWEDDVANTAFWTNMAVSVLVAAILSFVVAPLAGTFYDRTFGLVLAGLSLLLLIEAASAVHVAKLRREFRHKEIARRGIVSNIVSGIVGVALALGGWGVWAMVVSRVVAVGGTSIMLWLSSNFRPSFRYSFDHLRSLWKFSAGLLGSQLLNQASAQVPPLLIGSMLGPAAIAQYRVGWRSLGLLTSLVIMPIQSAAVSALARLAHDRELLGGAYLRLTSACALLVCPILFGIAAVAPDFVPLVFGQQWKEASYVLVGFALSALPITLGYFEAPVLNAAGRSDLTFLTSLGGTIGNVIAAALALPFGPIGVALALTARAHVTLPFALGLIKKATGVTRLRALEGVMPPYFCAAGMAITITILRLFVFQNLPPIGRLCACVGSGALIYPALVMLFARRFVRPLFNDIVSIMPARLRGFASLW